MGSWFIWSDVKDGLAAHSHAAAPLALEAGVKLASLISCHPAGAFADAADGDFRWMHYLSFHGSMISVHCGHVKRYVSPRAFLVLVFGADVALGDGGLVAFLDDLHSLDETFVAAVIGHLAELEHLARLDVALIVSAQQPKHGVDKGPRVVIFGEALDVFFHHRYAVLDRVAVAVDAVDPEGQTQGAVGGGERVAALVVPCESEYLGFHLQHGIEVAEDRILDRLESLAHLPELGNGGANLVIDHVRILAALALALGCSLLLFVLGFPSLVTLPLFGGHLYLFHNGLFIGVDIMLARWCKAL